jgi:hypothetical protein
MLNKAVVATAWDFNFCQRTVPEAKSENGWR